MIIRFIFTGDFHEWCHEEDIGVPLPARLGFPQSPPPRLSIFCVWNFWNLNALSPKKVTLFLNDPPLNHPLFFRLIYKNLATLILTFHRKNCNFLLDSSSAIVTVYFTKKTTTSNRVINPIQTKSHDQLTKINWNRNSIQSKSLEIYWITFEGNDFFAISSCIFLLFLQTRSLP